MLFAQIAPPPPVPSGSAAEVRQAPPPAAPVNDETQKRDAAQKRDDQKRDDPPKADAKPDDGPKVDAPRRESEQKSVQAPQGPQRDETGQPVVQRDATGQPIVQHDETGQTVQRRDDTGQYVFEDDEPIPQVFDSLLRPSGAMVGQGGLEDETRLAPGGIDFMGQLALIEGYNSNVVQSQDADGTVHRHPSPFIGVDASGAVRMWSSPTDAHELRLQLRGQHYTPIEKYSQPDDGSVNAGWSGQFTLAKRTVLTGRVIGTVTTVNSARLSDGALFLTDPTGLQRTYGLTIARFSLIHELSPRWRLVQGADVEASTTLYEAPISVGPNATIARRGLDFVQPGFDSAVFHDFDERNIGGLKIRYAPTYTASLLDSTRDPPTYSGKATTHMAEGEAQFVHAFSERLRSGTTVGLIVSEAPPLDEDRRPIMSPLINQDVIYTKQYWLMTANVNYSYGSTNPRLGFGPSASAGFTLEGTPLPNGKLRHLDLLFSGIITRAAFRQGTDDLSRLSLYQVSAEMRYGVTTWLGLLGGYSFRQAEFEGAGAFPTLTRHIVFLGLSGYWSTDRTAPTLQTFASPIAPPG